MNRWWRAAAFLECGGAGLFFLFLFRCLVVETACLLPVCAVFLPLLGIGAALLAVLYRRREERPEEETEDRDPPDFPDARGAG